MSIDSPYNFVPLAAQVVYPDWAEKVSHDVPLKQGLCGEISLCLEAKSWLLVSGEQIKASSEQPGKVYFFRTPDQQYAIPGSSLRGMVRNVLEIASFSRMQMVDDKRYGLRDISGKHVKSAYTDRVRTHLKYGMMRLGEKGSPEIVPCKMARCSHRDLEKWLGQSKPIFEKGMTVRQKYELWQNICEENGLSSYNLSVNINGENVSALTQGTITNAFPVFTGQISDYRDVSGKYRDFVFHSLQESKSFLVHEKDIAAWRDFLFIHGDKETAPLKKEKMSWPGFWKERFWAGKSVPVFYILGRGRLQIGLAYMPKLAGDFSIQEMIGHSQKKQKNAPDLATLIFGYVGEKPEEALKGRVQFSMGILQGEATAQAQSKTITSSPSPSYFPNYICQKTNEQGKLHSKATPTPQYATYIKTPAHPTPQLRGWKRYPVRPQAEVEVQALLGEEQQRNTKIQVILHPLPAEVCFHSRLIFHNLRAEELGALLWSLTFGNHTDCRHSLGMGKSFGFGQVSLSIQKTEITANNGGKIPDCIACFTDYMSKQLKIPWADTLQIKSLLAMADERQRHLFTAKLQHMVLSRNPNRNDFQTAKKQGLALQSYVSSDSLPPPLPSGGWQNVVLHYAKGQQELSATEGPNRAFVTGEEATKLLAKAALSKAQQKRLPQRKLRANLTVKHNGGRSWTIVDLEVM